MTYDVYVEKVRADGTVESEELVRRHTDQFEAGITVDNLRRVHRETGANKRGFRVVIR